MFQKEGLQQPLLCIRYVYINYLVIYPTTQSRRKAGFSNPSAQSTTLEQHITVMNMVRGTSTEIARGTDKTGYRNTSPRVLICFQMSNITLKISSLPLDFIYFLIRMLSLRIRTVLWAWNLFCIFLM